MLVATGLAVTALPRAVPLDALVSLASQAVPGWLLQRVVLAAVLMPARHPAIGQHGDQVGQRVAVRPCVMPSRLPRRLT